jgi:hypothetical protein
MIPAGDDRAMNQTVRKLTWLHKAGILLAALAGAAAILVATIYAALNLWPSFGAQAVDVARRIVGDQFVADVENIVLQSEDKLRQFKSGSAKNAPPAPWAYDPLPSPRGKIASTLDRPVSPPNGKAGWSPALISPLGSMAGEGQWTAFIQDASGNTLADRTYLQPDPARTYAYAAIVAFDLQTTRLHFVLGYNEPKSSIQVLRPGRIPAADLQAGRLLAAFNGGFKAQHGHFGVMTNGITLIAPRQGLGTVGIYDDGTLRIGAWGKDISSSPHLLTWRQNGPLIIQDGLINPHTADRDPFNWGLTVYGATATYRSGLGISQDGKTLYYAAGPGLTLPALARALQDAGAYQAVQLDINNYWVHFESFQVEAGKLRAVPLLGDMNGVGNHRFLTAYSRDYFYITTK